MLLLISSIGDLIVIDITAANSPSRRQVDRDEVTMSTCGYPNDDLRDLSHWSQFGITGVR